MRFNLNFVKKLVQAESWCVRRLDMEFFQKQIGGDLKVSRSQANIDEIFANYFLKTKAN